MCINKTWKKIAQFFEISVIIDKQPIDTNHKSDAEKSFLKIL